MPNNDKIDREKDENCAKVEKTATKRDENGGGKQVFWEECRKKWGFGGKAFGGKMK